MLINLHGGAFNRCADGCALVESIPIASVGRFKVITVDYREGPEHVFPAASEDVAAVYQDLLKTYRSENVGVYGCSAGGALTAQFGAWVVDKKLPTPGAFGMFSAGGLRGAEGDSYYVTHYTEGSMPAPGTMPASTGPKLRSYFEGADLKSALVSPALHPDVLAKFPPTLLITGSRSFDMSPVIYTHAQLLKAGVRAQLIVGEAMEHCYINHSDWPEARDTYDAIVRFFNDNLGKR